MSFYLLIRGHSLQMKNQYLARPIVSSFLRVPVMVLTTLKGSPSNFSGPYRPLFAGESGQELITEKNNT